VHYNANAVGLRTITNFINVLGISIESWLVCSQPALWNIVIIFTVVPPRIQKHVVEGFCSF